MEKRGTTCLIFAFVSGSGITYRACVEETKFVKIVKVGPKMSDGQDYGGFTGYVCKATGEDDFTNPLLHEAYACFCKLSEVQKQPEVYVVHSKYAVHGIFTDKENAYEKACQVVFNSVCDETGSDIHKVSAEMKKFPVPSKRFAWLKANGYNLYIAMVSKVAKINRSTYQVP